MLLLSFSDAVQIKSLWIGRFLTIVMLVDLISWKMIINSTLRVITANQLMYTCLWVVWMLSINNNDNFMLLPTALSSFTGPGLDIACKNLVYYRLDAKFTLNSNLCLPYIDLMLKFFHLLRNIRTTPLNKSRHKRMKLA